MYALAHFPLLLLVDLPHVQHLLVGLQLFQLVHLEGVPELQQLLLFILFPLALDRHSRLLHFIAQLLQLLLEVSLLLANINSLPLQFVNPISQPRIRRPCE